MDGLMLDKRQKLIVGSILLLMCSFFMLIFRNDISEMYAYSERYAAQLRVLMGIMSATIGMMGIGGLLLYYLKYGTITIQKVKIGPAEFETSESVKYSSFQEDRISSIEKENVLMNQKLKNLEKISVRSDQLTDEQKNDIAKAIKSSITDDYSKEFIETLEKKFSPEAVRTGRVRDLRFHYQSTATRLGAEVEALTRRANINLIVGSLTTVLGLIILGYMVFSGVLTVQLKPEENTSRALWVLAIAYLPRLSLVIFIQIFAFFFLRMYKTNLDEIKYFQNELTNAESKYFALESAITSEDDEAVRGAIASLSKTERNFVLSKGESTVELEKARMENGTIKDLLAAVIGESSKKSKLLGKKE